MSITLSDISADLIDPRAIFGIIDEMVPLDPMEKFYGAVIICLNYNLLNEIEAEYVRISDFKGICSKANKIEDVIDSIIPENMKRKVYTDLKLLFEKRINFLTDSYKKNIYLIENYTVLKELGRGSFGVVYLCEDISTGQRVVIKKVLKNGDEKKEYENELRIRSDCDNYFVCVIKDIDTPENYYIVMEYLEDFKPLEDYMNKINKYFLSDVNLDVLDNIIVNLCKGLRIMHEKYSIAHNDIKPDNVMVNMKTGQIKYIDFGIGCFRETCSIRKGEGISGTLYYMDPYAVKNYSTKGLTMQERSKGDLWSLGIMIYRMVSGLLPRNFYRSKEDYFSNYDYEKDINRVNIQNKLNLLPSRPNLDKLLNKDPLLRGFFC